MPVGGNTAISIFQVSMGERIWRLSCVLWKHGKRRATFPAMAAALVFAISTPIHADEIPSSLRSINAAATAQPDLLKELRERGIHYGLPVLIRIFKKERALEVWIQVSEKFKLFKTYFVCDCSKEPGPKERKGDRRSPEGFYLVTPAQMNPNSRFHLSFDIGYPNDFDLAQGRTGGEIMIHGSCFSKGCFAMTDKQMEKIYTLADAAFRNGQPCFQVHIFPFRMTKENMDQNKKSKWYPFWSNLKEGYGFFERERHPPHIIIQDNRYLFYHRDDSPHTEKTDNTSGPNYLHSCDTIRDISTF